MSAVANYMDVTIPTSSALVDRLVRRDLVIREDDPAERRKVALTITPSGQALLDKTRAEAQAIIAELLTQESPERLAIISEGLSALADAVISYNNANSDKTIKARVS